MIETTTERILLNSKELAIKLGVPVNTVYYWVSKNEIPYIKAGKHNRFDYEEVMAYFKQKTQKREFK
ncbi:MAG: excisionase [Bdellovibrio sp. CG12_big_fil_rev_8_21_14_0_65_39_13]|nr:MAG: excisionase [Bdellovibrio sp. CG22_combo_CG10-13_8_21_14_all_39_27]PIQ57517.1 MAG: excisionase [Bdellovibrio sp. CG12_big_fil_rev_8_21_14_0_65_39_13]PIR33719.1 MAG: excisionase [Bdellovibrio sp. CG11_big_fil_rev_8_21_14_0_20_39_38]PJB53091.1 MAG: excisionase [Bdellovibrio sp. CG_4_9_14_3_um_filter_39_7]